MAVANIPALETMNPHDQPEHRDPDNARSSETQADEGAARGNESRGPSGRETADFTEWKTWKEQMEWSLEGVESSEGAEPSRTYNKACSSKGRCWASR